MARFAAGASALCGACGVHTDVLAQDTTFPLHTPGPPQPRLPSFDVTSRCSDGGSPFGQRLLVGGLPGVACPGRSLPAVAHMHAGAVAGSYEDTCWMTKHISVPFLVYHQSELPDVAHTFAAGAQEAGGQRLQLQPARCNTGPQAADRAAVRKQGYLRFIAEYYDCLPEVRRLVAHWGDLFLPGMPQR